MSQFRTTHLRKKAKLRDVPRVVVAKPKCFEEFPTEIIHHVLEFMDLESRHKLREASCHMRNVHDQFVEHRVRKLIRPDDPSPHFRYSFCSLIYESTRFLHRISFPQFLAIFVSQEDLLGARLLHSSHVARISQATSIGDISELFEKLMLQYLAVVQAGCGVQRNKFKFLLILSIIRLLKDCPFVVMRKRHRSKFYIQFEFILQGGWLGSLWPSNERKAMNLPILLVLLLEICLTMQLRQSISRKVTDFSECVTVYGTDTFGEDQSKRPSTKFQFHINTKEPLIELVDRILLKRPTEEEHEKLVDEVLAHHVTRFFFELCMTCKEARKWGCAENCIIAK